MNRQQRMKQMVEQMQKYWSTYSDQHDYENYTDTTFLLDALYGIGLAINRDDFFAAGGFDKFKEFLAEFLEEQKRVSDE